MAQEAAAEFVEEAPRQLVKDIERISSDGSSVTFGALFNDAEVEQRYEALAGTLKAAKKKKYIWYDGELLLQGRHDDVIISIVVQEFGGGLGEVAADRKAEAETAPEEKAAPEAE